MRYTHAQKISLGHSLELSRTSHAFPCGIIVVCTIVVAKLKQQLIKLDVMASRCFVRNNSLLTARPWAERGSCSARDLFFLTARPWAERGSCFARDLLFLLLLTTRPWAERGSCFTRFTRDLLLTARPWAERGSCFTRDFFFFFVFLSVTRPKPPLGQITIGTESRNLGCLFAKSCWNNDVREMLRIMFSLL